MRWKWLWGCNYYFANSIRQFLPNFANYTLQFFYIFVDYIRQFRVFAGETFIKPVKSTWIPYCSDTITCWKRPTQAFCATCAASSRETFFLNQLQVNHNILSSTISDFFVDNTYTFELGGKNKQQKQIEHADNAFVVKDDLERGMFNILPLWHFGLMY